MKDIQERLWQLSLQGEIVPDTSLLKTPFQIQEIRKACKINQDLLDYLTPHISVGVSTETLNQLAYQFTKEAGATPAPLGYHGFPKSICTSINQVVCHGIPSDTEILKDGDIINIDVSTNLNGYFADASRMFWVGSPSFEARRIVTTVKECLDLGFQAIRPWGHLGDIAHAISSHAKKNGYSVVAEIGGHGIGLEFHEEPFVSHVAPKGSEMVLVPGMIFTIEPMINQGSSEVSLSEEDGWTVSTVDGGLSAQAEYMVLITEHGAEILCK